MNVQSNTYAESRGYLSKTPAMVMAAVAVFSHFLVFVQTSSEYLQIIKLRDAEHDMELISIDALNFLASR